MALTGNFTGSALGYALINLPDYTGDVVRLRRSSDNAESDFTGTELIDGTALTWVGANNAFVVTIYDQTGGGFHLTQATSGSQTQIATSGAWIVTQNGLPGIRFDGTGSYSAADGNYGLTDSLYCISVIETDNSAANMWMFSHNVGSGNQRSWIFSNFNGNIITNASSDGTDPNTNRGTFGTFTHSTVYIREDQIDMSEATASDTVKVWIDGAVKTQTAFTGTQSSTTLHNSTSPIRLGGNNTSQLYLGDWFLSVAFPDNKVADRADIYEEVRQYYYGDPLLLDTHPDAARAYALHKLRSTYQGSCIRVRRSNDNSEADIGFDGNGNLDTAALLSHIGAHNGFIVTWYDQSTNAVNATQATSGQQPRIVNSGTVETKNGLPFIYFDGSNDHFTFTSLSSNTNWTSFVVQERVASGGRGTVVGFTASSNAPYSAVIGTTNQIFISTAPSTSANAARYRASTATNYDTTPAVRIIEGYNNALTLSAYFDGSSVAMNAQTSGTASVAAWSTIGRVSSFYDNAWAGSVILWTSDKTAERADIYSNLESYYFPASDTPVTLVGQDSISEQGSISITTQGNEDVVLVGQDSVSEQGSLALVTNTNNALTLVGQDSVSEQESVELAIIPEPVYPAYSVKPIMHSKSRGLIYVINEEDVLSLYIDRGTRKVRTLSSIYSDSTLSAPTLLTAYEDDDHLFIELQEAGLNGITFQTLSYDLADESLSIVSTNEKLFTNSGAELAENVIPNSTNGITAVGTGSDYIAFTSTEKPSFVSGDEYVEALAQEVVDITFGGYEPLTHWTETKGSTGVNSTVNVSVFKPNVASTNADVAIQPKGTGAILAQLPDGTSTGGNKRGTGAVDLQMTRGTSDRVASGGSSFIGGGGSNKASGSASVVVGGNTNLSSNDYTTVGGGLNNTASGTDATVSGGNGNVSSGSGAAIGGGLVNEASGNYSSVAGGTYNDSTGIAAAIGGGGYNAATQQYATISGGFGAIANKYGMYAYGSGNFVNYGDNQSEKFVLAKITTDATPAILTTNLSAATSNNTITIASGEVYSFMIMVQGIDTSTKDVVAQVYTGVCQNNAGTTSIQANNQISSVNNIGGTSDIVITDNDTDDRLDITVTGVAATTIRWNAYVQLLKIAT